jgi:xanthine/uracil permease
MFGMVTATGIRILSSVDFKTNRDNSFVVAVSIGIGMIPLIAPNFKQWMPHGMHPLIESGILLTSISALLLNLFFNGSEDHRSESIAAAKMSED